MFFLTVIPWRSYSKLSGLKTKLSLSAAVRKKMSVND